jgi:hypothetical protein
MQNPVNRGGYAPTGLSGSISNFTKKERQTKRAAAARPSSHLGLGDTGGMGVAGVPWCVVSVSSISIRWDWSWAEAAAAPRSFPLAMPPAAACCFSFLVRRYFYKGIKQNKRALRLLFVVSCPLRANRSPSRRCVLTGWAHGMWPSPGAVPG